MTPTRAFGIGIFALALSVLLSSCSLKLAPEACKDGSLGQKYEQRFDVLRADTPVGGVQLITGHLPTGLSVDAPRFGRTFVIQGVPQAQGKFDFTLEIWTYGTNFPGKTGKFDLSIEIK